jgi:hypothetical protein
MNEEVIKLQEKIAYMQVEHEEEVKRLKERIEKLEGKLVKAGQMIGQLKKTGCGS